MDRKLQIWFCFWLKLIVRCEKRDWKVAKIAMKISLWGPLRGWYPELDRKKVVKAKTLAYDVGPHNDFVYRIWAKSADLHFQVCPGLSNKKLLIMVIGLSGVTSVCNHTSDLLITSMITDWIGQHDVLLPINQIYNKVWETNKKASTERWTILKRCYECWKTLQFTQQSAPEQRAQNGAYCTITSMTCATVQLMRQAADS